MSQLSDHYNRASAAVQPHYQKVQPYLAKGHKHAQAYLAPIDKELSRFPALNKFEAQTGVPKAYLGVGTFVLFVSVRAASSFAGVCSMRSPSRPPATRSADLPFSRSSSSSTFSPRC